MAEYYIEKQLSDFKQYGVTEEEIEKGKEEFGPGREGDLIWSIFNNLLKKFFEVEDYHNLKCIYYGMALFLHEEGKDPYQMLQESAKMELTRIKSEGRYEEVKIGWSANGCPSCKELADKVYSIEEALKELPIPNKDCSTWKHMSEYGFCRCNYRLNLKF